MVKLKGKTLSMDRPGEGISIGDSGLRVDRLVSSNKQYQSLEVELGSPVILNVDVYFPDLLLCFNL